MSSAPFATPFAHSTYESKYARPGENWYDTSLRVTRNVIPALWTAPQPPQDGLFGDHHERIFNLINGRDFIPGGRYLFASGNDFHQVQNCLLLRGEDTREGWADLSWKAEMALLTGAGIGVYYGSLREAGAAVKRTGGVASGPVPKMKSINELGRGAVSGGNRRCAIWAGLPWDHPDIETFIKVKDYPQWLRDALADAAEKGTYDVEAPMDMTNVSVCLNDHFFEAIANPGHPDYGRAWKAYRLSVKRMVMHGEPGFSVDLGEKSNEQLRNACTEITSEDDSDICNLGGMVLPHFDDPQQFGAAVRDAVLFLTAGTLYSDVPYAKVAEIREKNRRLGLDLIGVHEFCIKHGVKYGTDDAFEVLEPFMEEYDRALEYAWDWQDKMGLSRSVAATSGAPTGTRGIIAESTTGWEPVTSAAYKRLTRHDDPLDPFVEAHYVVDPTVARLTEQGYIDADEGVEDSFSLAYDYERRFKMQAYAQSHTDQAISMTINLPYVMTDEREVTDFGNVLLRYLPQLRGITCYPNGARAGQPITPVPLAEALAHGDEVVIEEDEEKCLTGGGCAL